MKRDLGEIAKHDYDIAVVGGGINGAAIAWDATLRGAKVALFEREDFGWATSSNSAKIGHCGMRYLQHADLKRLRESMRERNYLVQNAPHLVNSQPFIMPVFGHGVKGRETIGIYLRAYDLLSRAKKRFADPGRRVADSGMIKPDQVAEIMPGVPSEGLTGAGIWYEGQMHNTERLLLSYLKAAAAHGLQLANYADVTAIKSDGGRMRGVDVVDRLSGESFEISAPVIINATGPWALKTLTRDQLSASDCGIYASKAFSLLTRSFTNDTAFTFPIKPMYNDKKALVDKGSSMQFAIPWRDSTMIASLHLSCDTETPEDIVVTEDEIQAYIGMINEGYPAAKLTREDVRNVLWGIIPAEEKGSAAPLKHYKIIDHRQQGDINGLITVVGVKYTTARDVAQKTVDIASGMLSKGLGPASSHQTPLWGGDIDRIDDFLENAVRTHSGLLPEGAIRRLARSFGTGMSEVIALINDNPELAAFIPDSDITHAEIHYAINDEMAKTVADVVLRRTDMASLDRPTTAALAAVADVMGGLLAWDDAKKSEMVSDVEKFFDERPARLGVAA